MCVSATALLSRGMLRAHHGTCDGAACAPRVQKQPTGQGLSHPAGLASRSHIPTGRPPVFVYPCSHGCRSHVTRLSMGLALLAMCSSPHTWHGDCWQHAGPQVSFNLMPLDKGPVIALHCPYRYLFHCMTARILHAAAAQGSTLGPSYAATCSCAIANQVQAIGHCVLQSRHKHGRKCSSS
jgi:hypothetical protein